ncbi:MAG: STAS domain-containing protein [Magnetococcales bacterium]|nr:STAS domain-containing protein [Magnetococcales bacterium]
MILVNDSIYISQSDHGATVHVKGRFNFKMHGKFWDACLSISNHSVEKIIIVDLSEAEYVDSSALGMLLLLRDRLLKENKEIHIVNSKQHIKEIFLSANFHQLFHISEENKYLSTAD